jgi:hypothetical protein
LSQPDMKLEMVSPPAGVYIPSFTIYHVLPDLPGNSMCSNCPVVKNPENPGFLTNGGYLPLYICMGEKQVFYSYCSTCY